MHCARKWESGSSAVANRYNTDTMLLCNEAAILVVENRISYAEASSMDIDIERKSLVSGLEGPRYEDSICDHETNRICLRIGGLPDSSSELEVLQEDNQI